MAHRHLLALPIGRIAVESTRGGRNYLALSIKSPEADQLARTLAAVTGLTITDAIVKALRQQLERETGSSRSSCLADDLFEIGRRCALLPDLDQRTPEEILGYDEYGLPGKW